MTIILNKSNKSEIIETQLGILSSITRKQNDSNNDNIKQNGGEGSGHWGHSGRPGKVGGSTKSEQTLSLKEKNFEEFEQKCKEFKRRNIESGGQLLQDIKNKIRHRYNTDIEFKAKIDNIRRKSSNKEYKSLHSNIDKLVDEYEDKNISKIKDLQNQEQIDNIIFNYFEQSTLTERDKEVIKIYSNKSLCSEINGYLRNNKNIDEEDNNSNDNNEVNINCNFKTVIYNSDNNCDSKQKNLTIKDIKNIITDLSNTIDKSILKQDIRVYRGDLLTKERLEEFKEHFKDKTPMVYHSFTSTSFYEQSAKEFIRTKKESEYAYFFNINVKKGKGIGMYLDSESIKPSEIEFLIQKETYFMIDDIDEKNKVINMTVVVEKNIIKENI